MLSRRERLRKIGKKIFQSLIVREKEPHTVFLVGEMRSGTNMLTACLDRPLSVACYNETDDEAFSSYELIPDAELTRLISGSSATHLVFKSLTDSARVRDLMSTFAPSAAIWIYRDFDDVVNSAIKKWKEHRFYLERIVGDTEGKDWRSKNLPKTSLKIIRYYLDQDIDDVSARALIWYVRNKLFFDQRLEELDNVFLTKYEDLVQHPETSMRGIFAFLGLPFKLRYAKSVSTSSIRKDPQPLILPEIRKLCVDLSNELDTHYRST